MPLGYGSSLEALQRECIHRGVSAHTVKPGQPLRGGAQSAKSTLVRSHASLGMPSPKEIRKAIKRQKRIDRNGEAEAWQEGFDVRGAIDGNTENVDIATASAEALKACAKGIKRGTEPSTENLTVLVRRYNEILDKAETEPSDEVKRDLCREAIMLKGRIAAEYGVSP